MASGVGALGGTSHCYRFWLSFTECRKTSEDPRLCVLERTDYMECLTRENLKKRIMQKALAVEKQGHPVPAGGAAHGGGGH